MKPWLLALLIWLGTNLLFALTFAVATAVHAIRRWRFDREFEPEFAGDRRRHRLRKVLGRTS